MSIVILGSTSGSITLQEPAVAGTTVLSLPATTGTVLTSASPSSDLPSSINGPAFSAYASTSQSVTTSTFTKVTLNVEEFDTNSNFASSRFTPTVAGYYQINGASNGGGSASAFTRGFVSLYKNGSENKRGNDNDPSNSNGQSVVSSIIYLNGTTDYVELYVFITATSPATGGSIAVTYLNGCLVRAA